MQEKNAQELFLRKTYERMKELVLIIWKTNFTSYLNVLCIMN